MTPNRVRALLVASAIAICAPSLAAAQGEVNVYTYREHKLIQPLLDAFTKDTGIKVNVVSASSGLEQRIKTEGANSPADILLTVDIGRLTDAVNAGIAQPIKSEIVDNLAQLWIAAERLCGQACDPLDLDLIALMERELG